ncbi:MAG: DUF4271 domain-containing protein [Prevotellaceae bacterium]|nr:DUF4271 domain-containing protein [Prevotellaceae bacterium]
MPTEALITQDSSTVPERELVSLDSLSLQGDDLLVDSTAYYSFAQPYYRVSLYMDSIPDESLFVSRPVDYQRLVNHTEGYRVLEMIAADYKKEHVQFPSKDGVPLQVNVQMQMWFTPFVFLMFVLYVVGLAFSRHTFWREMKGLLLPSFEDAFYGNTAKEEFQNKVFLFFLSVINVSLFVYFCFNGEGTLSVNYPFVLAMFAVSVLMFYLLKILLLRLICFTFFDPKTYIKVERTFLLIRSMSGMCLIPVLLIAAYSPSVLLIPSLYVGVAMYALLEFIYLLKMVSLFFKGTFSIFYLILYLCTVEILPVIALVFGLSYMLKA